MAVYTELTQSEIADFLTAYDLPALKAAEGIRSGVENTNYLLVLEDGSKHILTLFEKRTEAKDLPFFAGLMEHLATKSIPAPMPVRGRDGQAIRTLKNKPALIVTFLNGKDAAELTPSHLAQLGEYTAKLHIAASDYPQQRANGLAFAGWHALLAKIEARADEITPGLADEMRKELAFLESTWPKNLPQGVIHADLFPDNVFFDAQGKLSGIIDFYFACNDLFAYEIAICLNAWCFDAQWEFCPEKAKAFMAAYEKVRPLSESERTALQVLARGAALRFLLTRTHDRLFPVEGALVTSKDPMEYLTKLRFHRNVEYYNI
ncbi:MAG TPA: homoserine kinase [Rickettsiales bacterium]|nr:homoserine kinase [Rickettsiales bacterium]